MDFKSALFVYKLFSGGGGEDWGKIGEENDFPDKPLISKPRTEGSHKLTNLYKHSLSMQLLEFYLIIYKTLTRQFKRQTKCALCKNLFILHLRGWADKFIA